MKDAGFSVFYDQDYEHDMWGHDLTEYFPDVFERRARFAVMFISRAYALKPWTRLERRSVLSRAMNEGSPYLLPVRLDDTDLEGVRASIAFLDGRKEGPAGVAKAIQSKLVSPGSSEAARFNGRVPRSESEASVLLGERPAGWEYIFFSYCLSVGAEAHESKYEDNRLGFALPAVSLPDHEVLTFVRNERARLSASVAVFSQLLAGPAQIEAMGRPGEPGDPDRIEGLAKRLVAIYADLLDWSLRLRATATYSDAGRDLLVAMANYASQPIDAMRNFIHSFQALMDGMNARLIAGEDVVLELPIKFEIDEKTSKSFDKALRSFERHTRSR